MEIKDLNGVYALTIKTNAGGAYSERPITGRLCIESGRIRGVDELEVIWSGAVEYIDDGNIKYNITVDPKKAPDTIIIRKENGFMTEERRDFSGIFKVAQKNETDVMLSSFENMADDLEYKAVVSLKRVSTNIDCAICKE